MFNNSHLGLNNELSKKDEAELSKLDKKDMLEALICVMKELRIDYRALSVMANGISPNIVYHMAEPNEISLEDNEGIEQGKGYYYFQFPVVQLSKETAEKVEIILSPFQELNYGT